MDAQQPNAIPAWVLQRWRDEVRAANPNATVEYLPDVDKLRVTVTQNGRRHHLDVHSGHARMVGMAASAVKLVEAEMHAGMGEAI